MKDSISIKRDADSLEYISSNFLETYISIKDFKIIRKEPSNLFFLLKEFLNERGNEKELERNLRASVFKFKKIKRSSNFSIDQLEKNLFKALFKGDFHFAKKFGKELFLRDENLFQKIVLSFSLMNSEKIKTQYALAMINMLKEHREFLDYILHMGLGVLALYPNSFFFMQKDGRDSEEYLEAKELLKELK